MKYSKKILLIISCISICISILFVSQTYAKYVTKADGVAIIPVSRWNIKVNNNSIKNGSNLSSYIIPIFPGSDNIAPNIVAPTAEGYFDLDLNYADTDVSFKYSVTLYSVEQSLVSDFIVTGFSVNDGPKFVFDDSSNIDISDTVSIKEENKNRKVRVFLKWDDSENSTMDNTADTLATLPDDAKALINVSISFIQVPDAQS